MDRCPTSSKILITKTHISPTLENVGKWEILKGVIIGLGWKDQGDHYQMARGVK